MDKLQKTESRFSVNISILASSIEGNLSISIVKGLTELVKTRDALPVLFAFLCRMNPASIKMAAGRSTSAKNHAKRTPEGQLFIANTRVMFIEISKSLPIQ